MPCCHALGMNVRVAVAVPMDCHGLLTEASRCCCPPAVAACGRAAAAQRGDAMVMDMSRLVHLPKLALWALYEGLLIALAVLFLSRLSSAQGATCDVTTINCGMPGGPYA